MELFLIYLVTRLTELKDYLTLISVVSGTILAAAIVMWFVNEFSTSAEHKVAPLSDSSSKHETALYLGYRRLFRRSSRYLIPLFAVSFICNALIPTSRDAITIAGGYGLVAAVKNERVQRLFQKSTQVATQWVDSELDGGNAGSKGTTPATATSTAPAVNASQAASASASTSTPASLAGTVDKALVTAQRIGDAASQVQGALTAVKTVVSN